MKQRQGGYSGGKEKILFSGVFFFFFFASHPDLKSVCLFVTEQGFFKIFKFC